MIQPGTHEPNATVLVDFDGTIAKEAYHNDPNPVLIPGVRKALAAIKALGITVYVYSARSWDGWGHKQYHDDMVRWLRKHRIPHDGVVSQKVPALAYVDDKAIAFNSNWEDVVVRVRMRKKLRDYQEALRNEQAPVGSGVRSQQGAEGRAVRSRERGLQQGHRGRAEQLQASRSHAEARVRRPA